VRIPRTAKLLALVFVLLGGALRDSTALAQTPLDGTGAPYLGTFALGLYANGNVMPNAHRQVGFARAQAVTPRDAAGAPSATGMVVVLSVGATDASGAFCTTSNANPPLRGYKSVQSCSNESFMGRAAYQNVESINRTTVTRANGAYPDQFASEWEHDGTLFPNVPTNNSIPIVTGNYTRIRDNVLGRFSPALSEAQVQVAWVQVWNANPTIALPDANADAYELETKLGNIVRLMKTRYPNLQIVFLSSRGYGGYSAAGEPYAYETGFAVKWLIQAQIQQMANGGSVIDVRAGDLNYQSGAAPWLAWGPYFWANGGIAKYDGPGWVLADFDLAAPSLGTNLSLQGQSKAALGLMRFFTLSPFSKCWFMAAGVCR
jgi:hypothetical protein